MKQSIICTLVALACSAGAAIAGTNFTGNGSVVISIAANGSGSARAYLGMVYNGPGAREFLGCQATGTGLVFCHAQDEAGTRASCSVQSSHLARSVASITPDSRVVFFWNANGVCTRLSLNISSEYPDKQD